jgi:hypothetical protein
VAIGGFGNAAPLTVGVLFALVAGLVLERVPEQQENLSRARPGD